MLLENIFTVIIKNTSSSSAKKNALSDGFFIGRGSKIRTHDTRFWRPMLYQLSYTPKKFHIL